MPSFKPARRSASFNRGLAFKPGARRSHSDSDLGELIPEQSTYMAVVNPTGEVIQTWGRGRRAVFVPGELDDKRRACIQLWRTPIAKQMVKNKRKFLIPVSHEDARALVKRARELGNFFAAWAEVEGHQPRAAQQVREVKQLAALRRRLADVGVDMALSEGWSIEKCRQILRDPTQAFGPRSISRIGVAPAPARRPPTPEPIDATPDDDDEDGFGHEDILTAQDEGPAAYVHRGPDVVGLDADVRDAKAPGAAHDEAAHRMSITKELKALKVVYHGRASTDTLEKLLMKAKSSPSSVGAGA